MRRRLLIAIGLVSISQCIVPSIQVWAGTPTVGVLVTHAQATDPIFNLLREGLRRYGYEEGRNIQLRILSAEGHLERLPVLAEQLVEQRVDVIIATNEVSTRAAQKATTTIPIVMIGWGYDPLALGLIDNLRRPSGNTTGTYSSTADLESKRLEILKLAIPKVSQVAVVRHTPFGEDALTDLRRAAQALAVQLDVIEIRSGEELRSAFRTAKNRKAGAVLLVWSPIFYVHREQVATLALEHKLPTIATYSAETGAFISYGLDGSESALRAGYYVDRLLKGTKPSELPVEQISKLRLVVNLKVAHALGINIPDSILVRADEVVR